MMNVFRGENVDMIWNDCIQMKCLHAVILLYLDLTYMTAYLAAFLNSGLHSSLSRMQ